jgi:hypothetical protein
VEPAGHPNEPADNVDPVIVLRDAALAAIAAARHLLDAVEAVVNDPARLSAAGATLAQLAEHAAGALRRFSANDDAAHDGEDS